MSVCNFISYVILPEAQNPEHCDETTDTDKNNDCLNVLDSIVDETVKTNVQPHPVNGAVNVNIINVYVGKRMSHVKLRFRTCVRFNMHNFTKSTFIKIVIRYASANILRLCPSKLTSKVYLRLLHNFIITYTDVGDNIGKSGHQVEQPAQPPKDREPEPAMPKESEQSDTDKTPIEPPPSEPLEKIPSFDEWKQKQLAEQAEQEKSKQLEGIDKLLK